MQAHRACLVLFITLLAVPPLPAQVSAPTKRTAGWTHPKTPWGDPDLRGIWPSGEMTGVPLQRPERFGERTEVNDEEFAQRQEQLVRSYERFVIGAWGEQGKAQRQASLIVEPPNGRRATSTTTRS